MEGFCRIYIHSGDECVYVTSIDLPESERNKLVEGIKLKEDIKITAQIKNKTKKFPDLLGDSMDALIVSDKIKNILESIEKSEHFQFLRMGIAGHQYWLLNILNNIACFDWEKSKYTTYANPNVLRKIEYLVLDKEKLISTHIFRMREKPFHVFISKQLHDIILNNNVTGIRFIYTMNLTIDYDP